MKKFIATLIIVNAIIWFGLSSLMSSAKANDYNTATTVHIITETLKGTDMDHSAIMNAEIQKLVHNFSMEIIAVFSNNLPSILDSLSAELRANADKHLEFGIGRHTCLGKSIALMQLKEFYSQFLNRFKDFELNGEWKVAPNNFVHAIQEMPIKFTPE